MPEQRSTPFPYGADSQAEADAIGRLCAQGVQPRPFRDLCPEAGARDAMDDGAFWEHVARNLGANVGEPDDVPPDVDTTNQTTPCTLCGEHGACGYDSEGRPMIHALDGDDDTHF